MEFLERLANTHTQKGAMSMSLHIRYSHKCQKCNSYYLPYAKEVACPQCGLLEEEVRERIIDEIANSANYQKKRFGVYTPMAWWVGSFSDAVALYIFKIFDTFYRQDKKGFEQFSFDYMYDEVWQEEMSYLKPHFHDIARLVFEKIDKN